MSEIKLSIVMPTFNREAVVLNALNSVLSSARNDIEVIVSDDGSTDNTMQLVRSVKDKRLVVVESQVNRNANYARNRAIEKAKGNLVAFLDSDDEFLSDRIDGIISFFEDDNTFDVLIDSFLVYKNNKKIQEISFTEGAISNEKLSHYLVAHAIPITCSTIVTKRSALIAMGCFDETFGRHQDRDYLLSAINSGQSFYIRNGKDVIKHQGDDSFSRNYKGYIKGLDTLVCKHDVFLENKHHDILSYFISRIFIKSISTFDQASWQYNKNAYQEAACIHGSLSRHIFRYLKGKKIRKSIEQDFFSGKFQ
ncbi:MAG: glycosyltransferase [Gammaproteobacteria bacterium]|nr:glycosyltransferase [Gammaproteobacteria bacterium]